MNKLFLLISSFILVLFSSLLFTNSKVFSQVTGSGAPNTMAVVNQCLSTGGSAESCAAAGVAYLQGVGFPDSSFSCTATSCTITCSNGASVTIPKPAPPQLVNCPTSTGNYSCGPGGSTFNNGKTICNGDLTGLDNTTCGKGLYCWYCPPAPPTQSPPTDTCTPAGGTCQSASMLNTSCNGSSSWAPRGGVCGGGNTCMWCPPPPVVTQPPTCPNNICGAGETCNNCPQDCGVCQPTATATPRPSPTPTNTPTPRPSPTPTPTPTATPTPTNTPTPTPTPTATPTPTPTPTPSPTPTPTPTPFPFDNSMCQCDGIKKPLDPIVIGNPFHVTAYGKVMGVNKNYAKIPTFTFSFYKGGGTVVTLVKPPEKVNTTVIEDTADKTKYQAIWTLDLSGIDKTQTYRIQAHPDCSRKAAVNYFTPSTVVLGASTKAPSFWDRILAFIFGSSSNQSNQVSVITPTPTLTAQQKKNLQLQTFTPAKTVETGQDANNCTFIKFSF